jgi:GDPmannose 4,6-dehydratase
MGKSVALIIGVTGQVGAYLARLLLANGYAVHGTSRDAAYARLDGLTALGIRENVTLHSLSPADFQSVMEVIERVQPVEIYNLSGQSSVGLSFSQPVETLDGIVFGTLNMLEALRRVGGNLRFYNAGSSECFGDTGAQPANEQTAFRPRSPYGVAKAAAISLVANYRESYDLFACSGILFNHESPLRPHRFVTRKITANCARQRRATCPRGFIDPPRLGLGPGLCRSDVGDDSVQRSGRFRHCLRHIAQPRGVRGSRICRGRAGLACVRRP